MHGSMRTGAAIGGERACGDRQRGRRAGLDGRNRLVGGRCHRIGGRPRGHEDGGIGRALRVRGTVSLNDGAGPAAACAASLTATQGFAGFATGLNGSTETSEKCVATSPVVVSLTAICKL